MISLYGGLYDRKHEFSSHVGTFMNIHNIAMFNTKTINVMHVNEYFENKLFNDLDLK